MPVADPDSTILDLDPSWDHKGLFYRAPNGCVIRYHDMRAGYDLPRWECVDKFGYTAGWFRTYDDCIEYFEFCKLAANENATFPFGRNCLSSRYF